MHLRTFARARYVRDTLRLARTLRGAAAKAATSRAAVEAAFHTRVGSIAVRPTQVPEEMVEFLDRVRETRPRRVLEIGTANGGTLYLLAWASAPDARILSVDVCEYDRIRRRLYRSFGQRGQRLDVLHADSRLDATRTMVERYFVGEPVDLLFIDGDHAYESVKRDFELYGALVRAGGAVAFHDIAEGPESFVGGVPRFWREVQSSLLEPLEIVHSPDQGGYGIGVGVRSR